VESFGMPHRIEPYDHYNSGESIKFEFKVEDRDENPVDISAANFNWYLLGHPTDENNEALYSSSDLGINIDIIDAQAGRVDLVIDADVIDEPGRELWHRLVGIEGGDVKKIWSGDFPVHRP
jgi:hypothetical protein